VSAAGIVGWAVTYAVHSTLLLGLAALLGGALRSDALRELAWKYALVGGIMSATLAAVLGGAPLAGRWNVEEAWRGGRSVAVAATPTGVGDGVDVARAASPALPAAAAPPGRTGADAMGDASRYWRMLVVVWVLGAAVLLGRMARAHLRLSVALRGRRHIVAGPAAELLAELPGRRGWSRPVRLSASAAVPTPLAMGRGEICVPERFLTEIDAQQQRAALAHELAHLRRGDPLWQAAAGILESVFFFQPLNRLARRRLREAAEHLCDDWAVQQTGSPLALARCLAAVGSWLDSNPVPARASALAGGGSALLRRVRRLSEWKAPPPPPAWSARLGGVALIGAVAAAAPAVSGQPAAVPEGRTISAATAIEADADGCAFVAHDTVTVSAVGLDGVRVRARPGSVRVEGRTGATTVRVVGRRCASRAEVLDALWFDVGREGNTLALEVRQPAHLFSRKAGTVARIDFVLEVPPALVLDIRNSLGAVELLGVGPARVEKGVGDVRVSGLSGGLEVTSGPGRVRVTDVRGSVTLDVRSGSVEVDGVTGDVNIGRNRAGPVDIRDVQGSVAIGRGRAGDVRVRTVTGDLVVGRMREGTLQHEDVGGRVRLSRR
jgi:beta-lactamase regulating signal transducer with metallopeptidase domain